jgi:formate dehydrogenase major subunit
MYSLGDGAKTPKHPFSISKATRIIRSTVVRSVPKGAGLVDFIHSESRLKFPEYRAPGSDKWQQISWDEAFDRIAKLMKEGPRCQLYRKERRRHHRQPLVDHRDAVRLRLQ